MNDRKAFGLRCDLCGNAGDDAEQLLGTCSRRECGLFSSPGAPDPVNRPAHYTAHPSGVECIEITEHMNFCLGNAMKYIWRAGLKGEAIQDLEKARWYLEREIERRKRHAG